MLPQAKEHLRLLQAGTGKEGPFPCSFRGSIASRTVRRSISVVLSHPICGTLIGKTQETNKVNEKSPCLSASISTHFTQFTMLLTELHYLIVLWTHAISLTRWENTLTTSTPNTSCIMTASTSGYILCIKHCALHV